MGTTRTMDSKIARRTAIGSILSAAIMANALFAPASAASVNVIVNGQQITFDQPPIERAGRVFVPLRGVFEHLGASVVYANGVINATGNGRNISLRIGSTQATVNGQTQNLDVAPFLVGARTLVPLRFVAQALGANVDWNNATSTVTITGSGGQANAAPSTPQPNRSFYLTNKRPETSTTTASPAIHAEFSEPVRRDTLRVTIDGNDVTNDVYANANGFDVTPRAPLTQGSHRVGVSGTTQAGASFSTGWSFTTGSASGTNAISNISPAPNTTVGGSFTLKGHTLPNSHVHIVASGQASAFGGLLQVGTGTFQTDTTADANGNFSANIATNATSGGQLRVLIQSTAPNGSSAERSITYSY